MITNEMNFVCILTLFKNDNTIFKYVYQIYLFEYFLFFVFYKPALLGLGIEPTFLATKL